MKKIKPLIKKELYEVYLNRKIGIIINILISLFIIPSVVYGLLSRDFTFPFLKEFILTISCVFIFVTLGTPLVIEHFYKDRTNFIVYLACGISLPEIFLAKIFLLFICVYIFYLLGILISLFINSFFILKLSFFSLLNFLFFSPLLGANFCGIQGILHLFFKDPRLINFIFILPFALFFVSLKYFVVFFSNINIKMNDFFIFIFLIFLNIFLFILQIIFLKNLKFENLPI